MHPALLLIPAAVVAGGVAVFEARKKKVAQTGTSPNALKTVPLNQLPPQVQAALQGPGEPPNQFMLNGIAANIAQGVPGAADPNGMMKARNGLIFDPRATTLVGDGMSPGDIQKGDTVTFSVSDAGFAGLPSIPSGSSVMTATSPNTRDTVSGVFIDPRVPEGTPVSIPLHSVTGVGVT